MNYDQRINFLKEWFKTDILSRFNMPRDLDPKVVALDVIEAVNRNISSGKNHSQMSDLVASITKGVTQSARSRTLPPVKEFIDATRDSSGSDGAPASVASSYSWDPYAMNAARIRQGAAVADIYLHEPHRKKLIEEHGITEKDLEPYNIHIAQAAHKQ